MPLLAQCKHLVLMLSLEGDKITVITQPKATAGAPAGLSNQMHLVGTAAELDAGFIEAVLSQTAEVKSIADQVAENQAKLEAEKKQLAAKSASRTVKPNTTPSEDPDEGEETGEGESGLSSTGENPASAAVSEEELVKLF